jgi:2-polyprenyl-6-hydroxyphenyl methylase/3-demethylubiquinone-9 3-methyltransferase
MAMQQNPANFSDAAASTVDPAEIAKFSKLSDEWWDPNGKMAPRMGITHVAPHHDAPAASSSATQSLNCHPAVIPDIAALGLLMSCLNLVWRR